MRRGLPWSSSHRGVLIALLIGILIYLIIRATLNPVYVSDPQPPVPARASEVEDRIDPNTAEWHSLAALPSIGERRARDIIAYREQFVSQHPGQAAFAKPEDLTNIRGIGTGILAQIQPYLIFPTDPAVTTRPLQ